jgi:aminoglycoside phosphotransferase
MKLPRFEDFKADFTENIWLETAKLICRQQKISFTQLRRAEQGESVIFLVDEKYIVKIYNPLRKGFHREKTALEIARTSLKIPEIVASGRLGNYKYLVTTQLQGAQMTREIWLKLEEKEQITILGQLARGLKELHASNHSKLAFNWVNFIAHQTETCGERQKACQVNERVLAQIPQYLSDNLILLPVNVTEVFMHGDVHFGNLRLLKKHGKWQISGLFDFADSLKGFHEYEFLAVGLLMIQGQGNLQREFFRASGYPDAEINEELRKRLMLLTMFYECSDLRRYAIRLRPEAVGFSLLELEPAIWNFC